MKQGGVLVPRKNYLIHTAYEPTVEPGTYGDHGIRIYGIWSPITGKENKICTHVHTWKMVKKAPANPGAESAAQGDPVAPWTRGNNCLLHNKRNILRIMNDFTPPKNHFGRFKRVDFISTNYPPKRL